MKYSTLERSSVQAGDRAIHTPFGLQRNSIIHNRAMERKTRFLSVACYFGLAPFLWFSGAARQQDRVLRPHVLYSLAFSFLLLLGIIFYIASFLIAFAFMDYLWHPTLDEYMAARGSVHAVSFIINTAGALLVTFCCLTWLGSVRAAWRASAPRNSLISWLISRFRFIDVAVYWSLMLEIAILFFFVIGFRSLQVVNAPLDKAQVFILYTDQGYPLLGNAPPSWVFNLAFYPLVQAGMEKYEEDSIAVLPLSEETFNQALLHGKLVFVASHGGYTPGSFTISNAPIRSYGPSDVDGRNIGGQLRYVYFGGCYTGDLLTDWQQVLSPAQIKAYDRISYVEEHMFWVWFKSPSVIEGLN